MLQDYTVEELFFEDLPLNIPIKATKDETILNIIPKLSETLDSFSDDAVVEEEGVPIGFIGGYEVLKAIRDNPTFEFIKNTTIEDFYNKKLTKVNNSTSLSELIRKYKENERAFSVIVNESNQGDFLVLSAKNAINAGTKIESDSTLKDMTKKEIISFSDNDSLKDIIEKMFSNKIRRLNLSQTNKFISDRTILTNIMENNYLENIDNYLEGSSKDVQKMEVEDVPENTKITTVCKVMHQTSFPCITSNSNIITPWDILNHLLKIKVAIE